MPWNSATRPSIQVGILRSVAEAEGWGVDSHYAYLEFYAMAPSLIGLSRESWTQAYELVAERLYHLSVGDWIYSSRRGDEAAREAYFELLRSKRVDDEMIRVLDALREVADRHVESTTQRLLDAEPDVVGFTTMFSQNGSTLAVAERLRESGYTGRIVLGGSNCEGQMGRTLLTHFPAIDAVVDGPGEDAFASLLDQVAAGAELRSTGRLVTRGVADVELAALVPAERLSVPMPSYEGFFEQLEENGLTELESEVSLPVEFSRGCWWGAKTHCTFCGLNGATMRYRSKHPDAVASELKYMMDRYGVLDFFAVDNILDLGYLETALPAVEELRADHSLFFEVKANMEWADIRQMRRAGVRSVQPGIESVSTEGLRALRKGATAFLNVRFLLGCEEFDVRADWNILTGYPGETPASILAQIDLVASLSHLRPPHVTLIRFDRFSPYVENPQQYGLALTEPFPGYRFAYPGLPAEDLWNIAYHFEGEFTDDPRNTELRRRLAARIRLWRNHHETASFTYRVGFSSVVLDDRRPGLPRGQTVLKGNEAKLFRAVIGGTRFRDLQAQGWNGARWESTLELLHAWQRRRWVMIEGTKVIALPIRRERSAHRAPPAKGTPKRTRTSIPLTLANPATRP